MTGMAHCQIGTGKKNTISRWPPFFLSSCLFWGFLFQFLYEPIVEVCVVAVEK